MATKEFRRQRLHPAISSQLTAAVAGSLFILFSALAAAKDGQGSGSEPIAGTLKSEFGCTLKFEAYEPHELPALRTVVLAHGFMRSLKNMRGWAEHWQAHGVATVLVSFCNSHLLNGHHQRNAKDLLAISRHLGRRNVVYAGFSAGGLAAYLASIEDSDAAGYLGLDSVDSGRLAQKATQSLQTPSLFLTAKPSLCNAKGNMDRVIEKHGYPAIRIEEATHCHFELPYAPRCSWLCGRSSSEETERLQALIKDQATEWLLTEDLSR